MVSTTAGLGSEGAHPVEAPRRHRRRAWLIAVLALLAVTAALAGIKAAQISSMIKAGKAFTPPPEAVSIAQVKTARWPRLSTAVGTVVATQAVTVSSEVNGLVREIEFESGGRVKRGQALIKLDTATEQAQLEGAVADARLATVALERTRKLNELGASPPAELDLAEAKASQAQSAVNGLEVAIAKKTVRAPFDGQAGIRAVDLGQVVMPGTAIVSLHAVDPVWVEFRLPQQELAHLAPGQQVTVTVDAFAGRSWSGAITTISPEVDPRTRDVRVRATFANPDGTLAPGMFTNLQVQSGVVNDVVIIPVTSVVSAPYGDAVFVLEDGKDAAGQPTKTVRQQLVRVGEHRGDFVAVASGLEAGQQIVSSGAFKLRTGMAVKVEQSTAPAPNVDPRPPDR